MLWALVLFAVAVYAVHTGGKGNVVEIGLSIASVAYGCLLGVFLLGTLTRYATQGGAIVGMITGFALNVALWLQPAAVHIAGVLRAQGRLDLVRPHRRAGDLRRRLACQPHLPQTSQAHCIGNHRRLFC